MKKELVIICAIFISICLTDISNLGALIGSVMANIINPLLWLGIYVSLKINSKYLLGGDILFYLSLLILSLAYRYIEIVGILPQFGAVNTSLTIERIIWPVLAWILIGTVSFYIVERWRDKNANKSV